MSVERLRVDKEGRAIACAARIRAGQEPLATSTPLDPKDFLARIVMHIPKPRRHLIRYYGACSSVVRARRERETAAALGDGSALAPLDAEHGATSPEWRTARHRCAQVIRRISEVDPLVSARCGGAMRIIAFLTEPGVIGTIPKHHYRRTFAELCPAGMPGEAPPWFMPRFTFRQAPILTAGPRTDKAEALDRPLAAGIIDSGEEGNS